MSRRSRAAGVTAAAASAISAITSGASTVADWPVWRFENRSTSASKRWRISSTVDLSPGLVISILSLCGRLRRSAKKAVEDGATFFNRAVAQAGLHELSALREISLSALKANQYIHPVRALAKSECHSGLEAA